MKKLLCIILIFLFVFPPIIVCADNRDVIVYETWSGDCYHSAGCSYLKSSYPLTLEKAVNSGLRRCSRCDPPYPDFTARATTIPYVPVNHAPAPTHYPSSQNSNDSDLEIVFLVLLLISSAAGFVAVFSAFSLSGKLKRAERETEIARQDVVIACKDAKSDVSELYRSTIGKKTILEMSGAPFGCRIGDDGLPHGDGYTFYTTPHGSCYHKRGCCDAIIPINAYTARNSKYSPCCNCNPILPDLMWVDRYKEIKRIKDKYGL